jgi:hypothetical protein
VGGGATEPAGPPAVGSVAGAAASWAEDVELLEAAENRSSQPLRAETAVASRTTAARMAPMVARRTLLSCGGGRVTACPCVVRAP